MTSSGMGFLISVASWCLGLALLYVPIVTLVAYSFIDTSSASSSHEINLQAYRLLLDDQRLLPALRFSLSIAMASASISLLLGAAAAIGVERGRGLSNVPTNTHRTWFVRAADTLTMLPVMLPEIVLGLGLLIWFLFLRISLGSVSLVLAHVTFSVSYVFMTVRERIRILDVRLEDAAVDLGASPWCVFRKIQLPLMAPALIGGWMMEFTLSFDDFLISFFTSGPDTTTLPLALYRSIKFGVSPSVFAMAGLIFAVSFCSASVLGRIFARRSSSIV